MKKILVVFFLLVRVGVGNLVCAAELMPWETNNIDIPIPGMHSVKIDDRYVYFEVPTDFPTKVGQASEVISRGGKFDDWLKRKGEYQKGCFGMSWDFYTLGIPLFGSYAQFSISANLHVKTTPERRAYRGKYDFDPRLGYLPIDADRGDFSKPEEMRANMEKMKGDKNHATPVDEVIINDRKWYHYYDNSALYPDALGEYYVTGLAPDRYLKITITQYPVPVVSSRYPTYPSEKKMPSWMKKTTRYKEQVINSLRITKPEGSAEPDLYQVVNSPVEASESVSH